MNTRAIVMYCIFAGLTALAFGPIGLIIFLCYFIPAIVAYMRDTQHALAIEILNFFLGWTLLGWVGALIWAVCDSTKIVSAVPVGSTSETE